MRLSKTEQMLLERARSGFRRKGCVAYGYITTRRRSGFGARESAALIKLVEKGLVEVVEHISHSEPTLCRFGTIHTTEAVYRLTEDKLEDTK